MCCSRDCISSHPVPGITDTSQMALSQPAVHWAMTTAPDILSANSEFDGTTDRGAASGDPTGYSGRMIVFLRGRNCVIEHFF